MLKDAPKVDYTNKPHTEDARMRMLMRVPQGYDVEVDPNAAPIPGAQNSEGGTPQGDTGVTYSVDGWLRKKGIDPNSIAPTGDDPSDPRSYASAIDPDKARYEKPIVAGVEDETDIDLTAGEKCFRIRMKDGTIREIGMGETELRNLGLVQYREQQVARIFAKINALEPDTDDAEAEAVRLNDRLYKVQQDYLVKLVPTFADHLDVIAVLPLERYQRIVDTAQRYNALRLGQAVEGTPDEVKAYDEYRARLRAARQAETDPNVTGARGAQS
jgi:hypothetical protein